MKYQKLILPVLLAMPWQVNAFDDGLQANVEWAAACGAISSQRLFPGGFEVTRYCGGYAISGVGTTIDDAMLNAGKFGSLVPIKACRIESSSSISVVPGGYFTTFSCSNDYVTGFGTTATAAANNAFQFAEMFAAYNDMACSNLTKSVDQFVGGYTVTVDCRKSGYRIAPGVSGVGTTATAAGENALGFADILAQKNIPCFTNRQNVVREGVLYKVTFQCPGRAVVGYGSTATAAGLDALLNAQSL